LRLKITQHTKALDSIENTSKVIYDSDALERNYGKRHEVVAGYSTEGLTWLRVDSDNLEIEIGLDFDETITAYKHLTSWIASHIKKARGN
jgi:hypothetical protein